MAGEISKDRYDGIVNMFQKNIKTILDCKWHMVQNDDTDSKIDVFRYKSIDSLIEKCKSLNLDNRTVEYIIYRFCCKEAALADEYLFCKCSNGLIWHNPNTVDSTYDINVSGCKYDLKGSVFPKVMTNNFKKHIADSQRLINWFYDNQSRGIRNHCNNRIVLVYHSCIDTQRSNLIRYDFKLKEIALSKILPFCKMFIPSKYTGNNKEYIGCQAFCIFFTEKEDGEIICSLKVNTDIKAYNLQFNVGRLNEKFDFYRTISNNEVDKKCCLKQSDLFCDSCRHSNNDLQRESA